MINKAGAKSKLSEEEVNNIIYLFRTEPGGSPAGKIKAAAIHEFTDELHSEGRVRNSPSLDFWYKPGRLGTKVLGEFNKVDASELPLPDGKTVSVPKVKDLVEKKYKNMDELIDRRFSAQIGRSGQFSFQQTSKKPERNRNVEER